MNNEKPDLIIASERQHVAQMLVRTHGCPHKAMKHIMESGEFRQVPLPEIVKLLVLCYCKDRYIQPLQ